MSCYFEFIESTDEGLEPCVPISLEGEILDRGALDRQKSGGVFDGEGVLDRQESGGVLNRVVLYCLLDSLCRWRGGAACLTASNGARSTDRSPESFRLMLKSLGRIVLLNYLSSRSEELR